LFHVLSNGCLSNLSQFTIRGNYLSAAGLAFLEVLYFSSFTAFQWATYSKATYVITKCTLHSSLLKIHSTERYPKRGAHIWLLSN